VEVDARVGFVEQAPFERPFDVVLNSGVISFAPDPRSTSTRSTARRARRPARHRRHEPALARLPPPRRRSRPAAPTRELSGLPRERVAELLVARGYRIEAARYYQLTRPVPQLMALSERSARRLGCGCAAAAQPRRSALDAALGSHAAGSFDSWILRARKGRGRRSEATQRPGAGGAAVRRASTPT
jgi:hypothetical protein